MSSKKLLIGLDLDDVLYQCTEYAIEIANKRYNLNLKINEIHEWELKNDHAVLLDIFKEPDFYNTQPLYPNAKEMVDLLLEAQHDVVFITAIEKEGISVRKERLKQDFPQIRKVYFEKNKAKIPVDVLLDDSPININASTAKFPVLYKQNWNLRFESQYTVNNHKDFLYFISKIT